MNHLSVKKMRNYCSWQEASHEDITNAIILGDFGLPWYDCPVDEDGIHPTDKCDKYLLRWLNEKPFNILAVMGNHENYNMIEKELYDINRDGVINSADILFVQRFIKHGLTKTKPGKLVLDTSDWFFPIKIVNSEGVRISWFGPGGTGKIDD